MLDAVAFDYWNTLVHEGPEALVRARLPTLAAVLAAAGHTVGEDAVEAAHLAAFDAYQSAWTANRQYCVPDAVHTMVGHLGLTSSPELAAALELAFSDAGSAADLRLVPGTASCLHALRDAGVKLAIICDVGLTPTPVLLERLEREGLLELFDAVAFSEEVGYYKPAPQMFHHVLDRLGVEPARAAHVGDRLRTDVGGARAAGLVSVRFRGIYDDPDDLPEADIVIDDLTELPAALARL